MTDRFSQQLRTLLAGVVCLSILSGVLVVHAWPLWTGQSVLLPVTPAERRDLSRGESVRLDTPATRLAVRTDGGAPAGTLAVTPLGSWWTALPSDQSDRKRALAGRPVYVQLEPRGDAGESTPVSISSEPVEGRINLRGRIRRYGPEDQHLEIDYGLDNYFVEEGTAKPVEDALRAGRRIQMEIAVASSGHARIRRLLVDGVTVGR